MTFRELFIQWQAYQLDRWMHTAQLLMPHAGKNAKLSDFHPYLTDTISNSTSTGGMQKVSIPRKPLFKIKT
jgi:hypothetical protein